jgi:flagellar M-ring protein FliF
MDAVRQTFSQFAGVYRGLTASQRGTVLVVAGVVAAAFALLAFRGSSSSYVPLSWGKAFTTEELMNAEQTLVDAQLHDFRREGQRLLVPKSEVERYNAALLEGGTLPPGWGGELAAQFDKSNGVFESARTAQERKDIALANELQRVIEAVPDIEHGSVTWARSQRGRWPHNDGPAVTATVSVRPRRGRQITPQLVESLRAAVASMVPDLNSANVTVFDQSTGTSHAPADPDSPFDGALTKRIRDFTREYQSRIEGALSYIPGVIVAVHVDVDDVKSRAERIQKLNAKESFTSYSASRTRDEQFREDRAGGEPGSQSNRPRSLAVTAEPERSRAVVEEDTTSASVPSFTVTDQTYFAAMPKSVQVSVKIPRDYYEAVAEEQGVLPGTTDAEKQQFAAAVVEVEKQETAKAQATVAVLIPADAPDSAVDVSSYTPVDREAPPPTVPVTETVSRWAGQWGGTVVLGLFALWALWTLRKNFPKLPETEVDLGAAFARPPETEAEQAAAVPEVTKRDMLQTMVRDNPDVAASIIGKWILHAK